MISDTPTAGGIRAFRSACRSRCTSLAGRTQLTVELSDIAAGGVRFRAPANDVTLGQRARFMFVVEGSGACAAEGRITRINPGGEFIVELDKTSPAFRAFVSSLAI